MKMMITLFLTLVSISAFAHEGGHGSLAEGGKFGGITTPVIPQVHEKHAAHIKPSYKAELVRAESGKLSLYIFDSQMKILDLGKFSPEVTAKLEVKKKGKFTYFGEFKFKKNGTHYTAQLPKVEYKPFNIDLYFSVGSEKLFAGFSNLD